jgi:hypothetical protein
MRQEMQQVKPMIVKWNGGRGGQKYEAVNLQ